MAAVSATGIAAEQLKVDVSIARGLNYYTGVVYETFLTDLPSIGSVCSGGRYDDLANLYTKQQLPGVGASLGLDRLLAALDELNTLPQNRSPADLLITLFDTDHIHDYLQIANVIRQSGLNVELFPEPKKIGQQFKYADRQGIPYVFIAGDREFAANECQIKDLHSGESITLSLENDAAAVVQFLLNAKSDDDRGVTKS